MVDRDQRITELEEQLGKERAYSEVLETFVEEKIREVVNQTSEERIRTIALEEFFSFVGSTDWQTLSQRFNPGITPGSENFNIDETLVEIKHLVHQIQFDVTPQITTGIDDSEDNETGG